MLTSTQPRTPEASSQLGDDIFKRLIEPSLGPNDIGKFVAIAIDSGDYEVDQDDFPAIRRLATRCPGAHIWLVRAGTQSAARTGLR
jgi:hypothetical protein